MPIRIRYVSLPDGDGNSCPQAQEDRRAEAFRTLGREIENHPGGMELLRLRAMKGAGFAYYSGAVEGILADFTDTRQLEDCPRNAARLVFQELDRERVRRFCHLEQGGLLHEDEYEALLRSASGEELRALKDLPAVTLEPSDAKEPCRDHGEGRNAYGIPIYRCAWEQGWKKPESAGELLAYLIRSGFLPDLGSGELQDRLQNTEPAAPVPKASADGDAEEQKRWRTIVDFYCRTGLRAANLAPYPDSLLLTKGSWDLFRFDKLGGPDSTEGRWYEVSGLYARDPMEDVAPDAEYVAIDFGTSNTVAAVYQNNGVITTIPVGGGERMQMENPTILRFKDLEAFLAAYTSEDFRPKTLFDQVPVSHNAKKDYESSRQEDARYYLNQLKQWANDPNRKPCLIDEKSGQDITLGWEMDAKAGSLTVDPIELYAYYIGLSVNDLRGGRIYLRYLLSFSATYSRYSRERIRASFEKGLRKALPPGVGRTRDIEVRLWRDEATCYAVCAVNRLLLAKEEEYAEELQKGIFYGVYDFGGGTLDFSFGTMRLAQEDLGTGSRQEVQHFTQLLCGGSPIMGCENLLDELAYRIFEENDRPKAPDARNVPPTESGRQLKEPDVRCAPLMGSDPREYQDRRFVSMSKYAQANTCSLIKYLRKKWIGEKAREGGKTGEANLILLDEDGERRHEWFEGPDMSGKSTIQMEISDETIRNHFEDKVKEGIALFLSSLEKAVETHPELEGKSCHVFLAGSASQAERVERLFKEEKNSREHPPFEIHPPLPAEEDRTAQKKDPFTGVPTAKSGVAYGLLMSRPGAEDIVVEQKLPEVAFHYHIGVKIKPAANSGKGEFLLLLEKNAVPKYDDGVFRQVRNISQPMFELLYTFDDRYAMTGKSWAVNSAVRRVSLSVPPECVGKGLYIRAVRGSDICAELGVPLTDGAGEPPGRETLPAENIRVIGECGFAHGTFQAKEQVPPADRPLQPESQPQPKPQPKPESGGGGRFQVEKMGYRLEGQEPQWVMNAEGPQGKMELGRGFQEDSFALCWKEAGNPERKELEIRLRGDGVKRVFILEAAPPVLRLGCRSRTGMYRLTVDLRSREIREEDG